MQRTKLAAILRTFTPKEMRQFEKWMGNSNERLAALLRLTAPFHPFLEDPALDKEKISRQLFPGEEYNDARMRNLVSDLQEQAEEFLAWVHLDQRDVIKKQFLLAELNKRKLTALFTPRLKEARALLAKSELDMLSHSLSNFMLDREEYEFHFSQHFGHVYKAFKKFDNKRIIRSATDFYLSSLLYYYHIALDNDRIFGKKTQSFPRLALLAEELYRETGQDNVLTSVYLKIVQLLISGELRYYFAIKKELLRKDFDRLVDYDRQSLVTILTNYALRQYLQGRKNFMKEILELSDLALQKKLCFRDNRISHIFFFNYTYYNVSIGRNEAARRFVKKYSPFLQPSVKESTLHYCEAYILFGEKNYSGALHHLSLVSYDTPQRFIGIKNILLKIYYEKRDLEPVSFVVDSIRHKMKDGANFSDYYLEAEKNFLHYFNMLVNMQMKGGTARKKEQLRAGLAKPGYTFHREWLLKMAGETIK